MRVSIIGNRFAPSSPAAAGSPSLASAPGGFQASVPSAIRSYFQNAPAGASPSLGSQTISALLQLQAQELEDTEAHGHGGGGGGHHGGMKVPQGLEAAEAAESEEAEILRRRKKLLKTFNGAGTKEVNDADDPDAPDAKQSRKNGLKGDGKIQ